MIYKNKVKQNNKKQISIEVIDRDNKPFMIMPYSAVFKQQLFHRIIILIVRTKEGKIILRKDNAELPKEKKQFCWRLFYSHVLSEESCEDSAIRIMEKKFYMNEPTVSFIGKFRIRPHLQIIYMLYTAKIPSWSIPHKNNPKEFLAVDQDELNGMLEREPDFFDNHVKWAMSNSILFI